MALKDHFKWYASIAKDTALNAGDAVIVTAVNVYKNMRQGNLEPSNPEEAKREVDELLARIEARKTARDAKKPSNKKPTDSGSFVTMV